MRLHTLWTNKSTDEYKKNSWVIVGAVTVVVACVAGLVYGTSAGSRHPKVNSEKGKGDALIGDFDPHSEGESGSLNDAATHE